eukprot:5800794-Alexandrium_andersonii.AAC.1
MKPKQAGGAKPKQAAGAKEKQAGGAKEKQAAGAKEKQAGGAKAKQAGGAKAKQAGGPTNILKGGGQGKNASKGKPNTKQGPVANESGENSNISPVLGKLRLVVSEKTGKAYVQNFDTTEQKWLHIVTVYQTRTKWYKELTQALFQLLCSQPVTKDEIVQ